MNDIEYESADLCRWQRPLIICLVSPTAIAAFHVPWGNLLNVPNSDLVFQQATALLTFAWAVGNGVLIILQRRRPSAVAFLGSLLDLLFVAGALIAAAGQRSWFAAGLLLVVAAAARSGRMWICAMTTIGAAAIYLFLPTFQSLLGKAAEGRDPIEQGFMVALLIAAAIAAFKRDDATPSLPVRRSWTVDLLQIASMILPCIQLGLLDLWVGLGTGFLSMVVLNGARSPGAGWIFRTISLLFGVVGCLGGFAAAMATVFTGILLVDSLIPRMLEKLVVRFPQLQQPWIAWVAIFLGVFVVAEAALRAVRRTNG